MYFLLKTSINETARNYGVQVPLTTTRTGVSNKKGSLNMHHLRRFGTFQEVSLTLLEN